MPSTAGTTEKVACAPAPLACAVLLIILLALVPLAWSSGFAFSSGAVLKPDPLLDPQAAAAKKAASSESMAASLQDALARGEQRRAAEILTELLQRPRVEPAILLKIGVQLAQRELYEEAGEAFARCVREDPTLFEAHYNLALADFAQQKLPQALAALGEAPHRSAEEELALSYLRGKIEGALGRDSEAQRDLESAFSGAPQQENYALDLGLFYLRQRAYNRAEETFTRAAALNPGSPLLALGLAFTQFLEGHQTESIENSRKVLALQPDFSPARLLMSFALYMDGSLAEAEKAAVTGLTAPQPPPYLYYLHAVILLKLHSRDHERILNELAMAENAIPSCSLCYLAQSKAHQEAGDLRAAITDLERAVLLDHDYAEPWYRLAYLYERVGRHDQAATARQRFQELKARKENRETEMLRNAFIQTLGGTPGSKVDP